jgi:hypothetical protein
VDAFVNCWTRLICGIYARLSKGVGSEMTEIRDGGHGEPSEEKE